MRKRMALVAMAACVSLSSASGTPAAELTKVRIGFPSRNLMTMPLYVAEKEGIFKKHGIDLEIVFIRGGANTVKAIIAKKIDAILNPPISTMKAMQKGGPLTFVTALTQRASYQLVTKDDIKSLKELKGRVIGAAPGGVSYIMPRIVMSRSGLDPDIATYMSIRSSGSRRKALVAGKIDAAVMHVESALQAAATPGLHVLVSIPKILPEYPFFWLSFHNNYLKKNRKTVVNVIKAFIEMNRYAVKHKDVTLVAARKYMKTKPQYLSQGFDKLLELKSWSQNGGLTKEAYAFVMKVALDYKEIKKELPASQFMDTSYQEEALKEMGKVPEDLTIK